MSAVPIYSLRPDNCHSPLSDLLWGKSNDGYAKICNSSYHIKIVLSFMVCLVFVRN